MNRIMDNTYHFYEKALYQLTAGIQLYIVILLYQPINEVKILDDMTQYGEFNTKIFKGLSLWCLTTGTIFVMVSFVDMLRTDMVGFFLPDRLNKNGCEVPIPFKMK